jgi:hypothetical protein
MQCTRSPLTSMRLTAALFMSALNPWSLNTVRPSFSVSWNQSRHVTRLPAGRGGGHHGLTVLAAMPEVQLLKHSHSVNTTGDRPQKEGRNQARGVPCKSLAARAEIMESSSSVTCVCVYVVGCCQHSAPTRPFTEVFVSCSLCLPRINHLALRTPRPSQKQGTHPPGLSKDSTTPQHPPVQLWKHSCPTTPFMRT